MRHIKNPSREAVARSLRELEKLFGRKPPDTRQSAQRELGAGTSENKLQGNNTTVSEGRNG